jgi:RIO kinase 2
MSSIERAAHVLKSLKDEEWRTLAGLERAATGHGTADLGRLSRMSRLPVERVRFAVQRLQKTGFVARRGSGFALTKEAVEAMALKDYVKKDLIFALGAIIAKGKESDVYEAVTEEGTRYALKFYKLGRTSFTKVRKKRFKEKSDMRSWVTANYEAASREYSALRRLEGISPTFPRVISYSRSTVLLEEVSGVRLSQRPELEDASKTERTILDSMRKAYLEAGLVNGDLSEYNILTDGVHLWLIDWPQAVDRSHPNSAELLEHDVTAVVKSFARAYSIDLDQKKALQFVRGESASLE